MEVSWGRAGEVSARHWMAAAPGGGRGDWSLPRPGLRLRSSMELPRPLVSAPKTVWACPNESACRDLFGGSGGSP